MAKITIHDVARLAGASTAVVSRALNGRSGVSAATRQRVQAAAASLGYKPSRRLRANKVWDIAVISSIPFAQLERSPIYYRGMAALQAGAEEYGCRLIMLPASSIHTAPSANLQFDAALLYLNDCRQVLGRLRGRIPYVLVGRRSLDPCEAFVATDDSYGAYDAVKRLIAAGRRRIAYVGYMKQPELNPNTLRFNAYRQALTEAGVAVTPDLWSEADDRQLQALNTEDLIRFCQRVRPDAIFAFNDSIAIHVLQALQRLNVQVPAECAVIGFDDTYPAELCCPPLSTVHNPIDHVSHLALSQLLRTLELGFPLIARTLITPWFVRRQSCGTGESEVEGGALASINVAANS